MARPTRSAIGATGAIGVLIAIGAIAIAGCRRDPPFAPDLAYRDARQKFQQGDLPGAFADADRGVKQLESVDPAGAWRFRVLEAEALIWQGKSRDALAL